MNNFSAPYPRSRICTKPKSYLTFVADLISGRLNKGPDVEKLEQALSEKLRVSYVACIPAARVGIHLVIKNLIKPGQGVIMSPYTVADVVNMVIAAGGKPVFADIDQRTCNIDPDKIEPLIDQNTGAVLITHLHGIAAPAHRILTICQRHNLPMIEDVAQAFGASEGGSSLGTIGEVGIYSFGMYKNINSWYGGAVVSENKFLIDAIKKELNQYNYTGVLRLGKKILKGLSIDIVTYPVLFKLITFWIFRYGFLNDIAWINRFVEIELDLRRNNIIPSIYLTRFTPFQARLALEQLTEIDTQNKLRRERAAFYRDGLAGLDGLVLPSEDNDSYNIYPAYPVQYQDRKKMLKWLMRAKRDIAAQHLKNCADLPAFSDFYRDCPVARKTANEVIILPTYPRYPVSEVKRNIKAIRSYFQNN